MADTAVDHRSITRFFCHRCKIEFEDVLEDLLCPYCASGFIEQVEGEAESAVHSGDDMSISDADMSNLDDSDDMNQRGPLPNPLTSLMFAGRMRGAARAETLLERLVWTLGGGGPRGSPAGGSPIVLGGAPFVLVGAPGDYVFGGEGLDAVVTQLLGQLENSGPPPLSRERIDALPSENVSPEQAAANQACSVCWDNFLQGETISRLECDHIFHSSCIAPWLQLHATCPICRRSLAPDDPAPLPEPPQTVAGTPSPNGPSAPIVPGERLVPRVFLRRLQHQLAPLGTQPWDSDTSSSSITGPEISETLWAPSSNPTSSNSESSVSSAERTSQYNMDIEYD